jgi:hypothetical protein
MCEASDEEYAGIVAILETLRQHKRATEIMQKIGSDVQKIGEQKNFLTKTAVGGTLVVAHWNEIMEIGRIFNVIPKDTKYVATK